MPKINKRLYGPTQLPNTTGTRYTVPASTRAVIRAIHLSNPTGGSVDVTASIGADAAGTRFLDGYPIAADSRVTIYGPFTLEAAEILAMHASAATSIVAVVDGEEQTIG
jgi:hypothetical protein